MPGAAPQSDTNPNPSTSGGQPAAEAQQSSGATQGGDDPAAGGQRATGLNPDASAQGGNPAPDTGGEEGKKPDEAGRDFKIPDAFKDKKWAEKVKSEDDLFKLVDNLDGLVGKKHLTPDFDKAPETEIRKYWESTAPKDVADYGIDAMDGDTPDTEMNAVLGGLLKDHGTPAYTGQKIAAAFKDVMLAKMQDATSAEGFTKIMTSSFGSDFGPVVASVSNELKTVLSKEDHAALNKAPNETIGIVYRAVAGLQKEYNRGGGESSAQTSSDPGAPVKTVNAADMDARRTEVEGKIEALKRRPHASADMKALQEELESTYK